MTEDVEIVISNEARWQELPEWLNEGVVHVLHLLQTGRWDAIAERLRIQRSGGYSGIDIFMFLLTYFSSGQHQGISKFLERLNHQGKKVAAVGRRDRLPTQSSVSRILKAVDSHMVREVGHWLLWEMTGAVELLRHPAMQTLDANGEGWHVFDHDPTKTVLRRRGLPRGEDLPPARRHTDDFAEPGYSGRKRGEVQVSRASLQHAGSGIWLNCVMDPGNGGGRAALGAAIATARRVCEELEQPRQRSLLRMDGEFGNVPYLTMCVEAGLPSLTRLNRLQLLDQPDVRERMAKGRWYMVPDSGSGPRRSAMDLGVVTVRPGRDSVRDDGGAFEPIKVRVVVSRYAREGEANHGRVIDGWQYELFAALMMPPDAWPAPDVIAMYYGRGGQENRFAQEDRELDLDRLFSFHLPGQELAVLVGLMVWNLRVVQGFRLNPPPTDREPAPARELVIDDRPVPAGLAVDKPAEPEPNVDPTEPDAEEALADALRELDWSRLLRHHDGWSFDHAQGVLYCPDGAPTWLTTVSPSANKNARRLIFRTPGGRCRPCPKRDGCVTSANVDAHKMISFNLPAATGDPIRALLATARLARRHARSLEAIKHPLPSGRTRRAPKGAPLDVDFDACEVAPGAAEISVAPFLPAAARQAFRRVAQKLVLHIDVERPVVPTPHPYLADTSAKRQRRRATWAERLQWCALPQGAKVRVVVHGAASLAQTFPGAAKIRPRPD